jgi:nucleoside-diphosphate kinase
LEKFYAEHAHKPFFKALVDYMTSGEVVAVILEAPHACSKLRDLLGATDPLKAAKHTLRSKYGHNIDANGFHGSDNPEKYEYEKKLIFDLHSHVFAHHSVDETL